MLKVPQLDDITYEQLVQRAINKIPTMTDQWTDFNSHDPGVTVLQTYAWLVDMLNYYMNATGDAHVLKYLKLLGIEQEKAKEASTYLMIEDEKNHVFIPKGTKIYGGTTCFEFQDSFDYESNPFVAYLNEVDGSAIDLTAFTGENNEVADMFAQEFEREAITYFGFKKPLTKDTVVYFQVKEEAERQDFDDDFSMNELQWQYYSADGWNDVVKVEDGSGGFLKSGLIRFELSEEMAALKHPDLSSFTITSCYFLRAILKENRYDKLPKLNNVYTNPMFIKQQDTICSIEELVYQGEEKLYSDKCLQDNDYVLIGVEKGEAFEIGYEYEESAIDLLNFHREDKLRPYISFKEENPIPIGTKIQIIRIRENFLLDMKVGKTNGCCNQRIPFSLEEGEEISYLGISFWREEEDGGHTYKPFTYVENLERCDYMYYVFTYDKEEEVIILGDGIHGVIPPQGLLMCITDLITSKFGDGNIMPEEIKRFSNKELTYQIRNPEAAFNGKSAATKEEMLESLREVLFKQNRMVSVVDYKDMVKSTPGLMIEEVQVIDGKRYGEIHHIKQEEQTVYLVIKQRADIERPALSSVYKKIIAQYIEEYRLINTKVKLVSPNYVGVEVYGKIYLHYESEKDQILQFIMEQVAGDGSKTEFGKHIILGKMFTKLEIFASVKKVEFISMERVGNGAVKNSRGDIVLYEDAIPYLRSIQIEFV